MPLKIFNDTGLCKGTKIIDTDTGKEIKGIRCIYLECDNPKGLWIARFEAFVDAFDIVNIQEDKDAPYSKSP